MCLFFFTSYVGLQEGTFVHYPHHASSVWQVTVDLSENRVPDDTPTYISPLDNDNDNLSH
jgi:hypothetical protein